MLIVRATRKLLRMAGSPTAPDDEHGTTLLGPWYATVLFWRPRVVLLVNESTLLPVLMPLAPAATLDIRIGEQVTTVLAAHHTPHAVLDLERQHMRTCRLGATSNRSVVGVMTELARLAEVHRDAVTAVNLVDLALGLAGTPCGPLYGGNISPDRELAATLRTIAP